MGNGENMSRFGLLITNPNHHWQMTGPIARELKLLGHDPVLISYSGLRRLRDKDEEYAELDLEVRKSPDLTRLGLASSAGQESLGDGQAKKRRFVQTLAWNMWLRHSLLPQLRDITHLLVLNDQSFPLNFIVPHCLKRGKWVGLLQEGIRFPTPHEEGVSAYGRSGVKRFFTWGRSSQEYFQARIPGANGEIVVAGNPRYDEVLHVDQSSEVHELQNRLELRKPLIGFASNPIDDLGFCTTEEKYELVRKFFADSLPVLKETGGEMLVKLHPRESSAAFEAIIQQVGGAEHISLFREQSVFLYLRAVERVVILASTVGLEALALERPVAVLPIGKHGHVHDYVSSGAALPIQLDHIGSQLKLWLSEDFGDSQRQYVADNIGSGRNSAAFIAKEMTSGHAG